MSTAPVAGYRRSVLARSLALALTLPLAATAFAQDATDAEDDETAAEDAATLATIEVVGSRIKRSQIEGPSPVTVISAEQIKREGFTTVHDALETLSQNSGFGQNDFNAAGGFTPNAGVINLRGLGPGRTLLLINGRRANDYPFPYNGRSNFQNFNNIPAGAVERIEILAGGASAIYGSDAIAGVINVVLRTNYDGDAVSVRGQTSTRGGADQMNVQWTGGKSGDKWSLTYALEAFDRSPLFGWQRDFMDSAADNPAPPGVNGAAGLGGYQPPIGIQIRAQGGALAGSYLFAPGYDCSASSLFRPHTYTSTASGVTIGPGCGYDRYPAEQTVVNGAQDFSGYAYGTYDFNDTTSAWASLMVYNSDAELGGGVEQWFGGPQPNGTFYDPQFGRRILPIRVLTPETYGGSSGTFQKFEEESYDVAFGLRGSFGDRFDWDATISTAKYDAYRTRPRMTVEGATAFFMGPRLGTVGVGPYTGIAAGIAPAGTPVYALNLDRFYGPISAADYASMSTQVKYEAESENKFAQFAVTGDLFELPAGPVGFAAIVETNSQSYDLNTDARLFPSVRAIYNLTGTGGGGERDRYAAGVEFSVPVFSTLTASMAARYDKYDDITDVDDAITYNGGLEWRPFESLLVRGSYSTSFKAPDMHYIFAEASGSFGTVTDFTRCDRDGITAQACSGAGAAYNYQVFTTSQGQPGLIEETGESYTVGFVWDIVDSLTLTADYWQIKLEDEVTVQSGSSIIQDEFGCTTGFYPNGAPFPFASSSAYCAQIATRIDRDPTNDDRLLEVRSGPINLAARKVNGIDAALDYRLDTDRWGNFQANIAWSHTLKHETVAREGDNPIDYRDANSTADFRSRVRVTMGWSKGDWDATVFVNRYGSFPRWVLSNSLVTSGVLDDRAGPHTTVNLSVGKQFTPNFSARLNINNVFDDIAPSDPTFNAYPYFWQAYSPIGREVGLTMNYRF
ncbi:MAG TPA: TonB-dependent receptor [Arenimonas sp.]|uniref:TonB-dependent receptor plug domain-containing protein n=1 Tax=Arenimonas sp. TaxID=1872635 RepID=UPI002D7E1611|nr:TonB-dependent receptor [Arenimonas sp.]HEU0152627.1 TonB-dependent receptor [Arenimonas sp.]